MRPLAARRPLYFGIGFAADAMSGTPPNCLDTGAARQAFLFCEKGMSFFALFAVAHTKVLAIPSSNCFVRALLV
jgi:hypothetical protein